MTMPSMPPIGNPQPMPVTPDQVKAAQASARYDFHKEGGGLLAKLKGLFRR